MVLPSARPLSDTSGSGQRFYGSKGGRGHYRDMHCAQCGKLCERGNISKEDNQVYCDICYGNLMGKPREQFDKRYQKKEPKPKRVKGRVSWAGKKKTEKRVKFLSVRKKHYKYNVDGTLKEAK